MTNSKPKGRQRNSSSHSKNGCATCKMRRVKCGEERPECYRCQKSGWRCDRYDTPPPKSKSPIPIQPHHPTSLSTYTPSGFPKLDAEEQKYFQIYLDQTSTTLEVQDTTSLFWKRVVLQESYFNACVRHALVAIGAVAKSAHTRSRWAYLINPLDTTQEIHRRFALIQYQKAIQGLRSFIGGLPNGKGDRSTLICCMVLTLFDCFYGNVGFAAQHIRFGRKILTAWMSSEPSGIAPTRIMDDPVDCHLIHMFASLDIQASSFLTVDKENTYSDALRFYHRQPSVSTEAQTAEQAKRSRQEILFVGYNIYLQILQYSSSLIADVPWEILHQRDNCISQLKRWNNHLDNLCREEQSQENIHPFSRISALRLYTTVLLIRLLHTLDASATHHDEFHENFEYLLSFSKEVIDFEASNESLPPEPNLESYTFEMRIIPALYLVATKCRQPSLRREAIGLLKSSHRREGLWDSFLSARIAEWIIQLELGGLEILETGANSVYPTRINPIFGEAIELDVQGRQAEVKCSQVAGDGILRNKSTLIAW